MILLKIQIYHTEAKNIADVLSHKNDNLNKRLLLKIEEYEKYL